jgi:cytochrome c2
LPAHDPDDPGAGFGREATQGGREMMRNTILIAAFALTAQGALAEENAASGEQIFEDRCASCHSTGGEMKNAPDLANIIGRPAASLEGFKYSDAMIEARQAGVVWDIETLSKFIAKPRSVVNGSNMAFTGLREPTDVAAVIAYLAAVSTASP